jgi:phosphoglycerol transferase MdoB-like AlkP superfamily enzyme
MKMVGKELFFIADFVVLPFLFPWLKKQASANIPVNWVRSFSLFFLLGLFLNIFPWYFFNLLNYNYFKSVFERKFLVYTLGIVNYQIYDIYHYLQAKIEKNLISEDDKEQVRKWLTANHNQFIQHDSSKNLKRFNLIVIQAESLQNFVIGMEWKGREVTPNLNRLARDGIYFNQIYDQTWTGNTSDATFLANCSLYPSRRGAASFLYTQNDYNCLPHILREQGYTTATMHAYKSTYWNRILFEKAVGFQHQFYENSYVMEDQLGWGLSDQRFFAQSVEKIIRLPSPFYVFLTTLTTHVPFDDVTAEIDNFPLSDVEGKLIGNYLRSMHYVDSAIGEFLKYLSDHNLMSNTVTVVYGDHRARFEEGDLKSIGIENMDELNKIPVIIKLPDKSVGYMIDTIGGLIDLAPTMSNLLGIDTANTTFLGRDLINQTNNFVAFRDGSYITKDRQIDNIFIQKQLSISDLILEKDLMKIMRTKE